MLLNAHSTFSLRYGTLSVESLVSAAVDHGFEALALTDINNTSACMDFVAECGRRGVKPLVGIEFRNGNELLYIGLARNAAGFGELNAFLTRHNHAQQSLPQRAPAFDQALVIYPLSRAPHDLTENEWVGVRPGEVNALHTSVWRDRQDRLVMLHTVTFADKTGWNLHRLLRAVSGNTLLSKLTTEEVAPPDEVFVNIDQALGHYRRWPRIISNTFRLVEECNFSMDFSASKNKRTFTGSRYDDRLLLEKLAWDGLRWRYGPHHSEARARVAREIEIIDQLSFSAYFLINWDFVRYAQSRNFFHVGRGSGANSIVAYCMGITDVDPIDLDLYFERFLNPHRASPPDFDIDFSWKDRDEIIDYIFKRYGMSHTALLATYSTFKGRSILRELGKVFGLPKGEIDALVEMRHSLRPDDKITRLIHRYGKLMEGMPNHLGIHAGGILISEEPITTYTATEIPPKGFPITQFDMFVAEDIGLHKFDVLSQRGLGHIKDAADLVQQNRGIRMDVHQVDRFKKDEKVRELVRNGDTLGCFYVESPAMRQLLSKLRCDTYRQLVAASSIIRPGVARSGMMRAYIERHNNPAGIQYLHPKMEELLAETYGVMVYQEDVIKVAHHFAGIELAEADVLRRVMSGKYRTTTKLDEIKIKFFSNCRERGYAEEVTAEVWRQIESFSGYSFSKAHSASFAVESYQSLFLRAHYPLEFMVAVINNFGGFYSTEVYLHGARMAGGRVHAPCVNHSQQLTVIEGCDIYLGFGHVQGFEQQFALAIERECAQAGPFADMEDLLRRVPLPLEQILLLVRVGALRFTGKSKKELLWEAHLRLSATRSAAQKTVLFAPPVTAHSLPVLDDQLIEDAYDELELLGFPLCSPFDMAAQPVTGGVQARGLASFAGQQVEITGYFVNSKQVMTIKNELMLFGCFIDREGMFFDTTHFPDSLRRYPVQGRGLYRIRGLVTTDFGVPTLEVSVMERLPVQADPRRPR